VSSFILAFLPSTTKSKHSGITPEEAAKNRAEYKQRMREAQQHKAEVEARNAKRTQPPAAPLPPPPRTGASGS